METYNPLRIIIDPGHGGEDSGAVGEGRFEKDDTLRLGLAVREALTGRSVDVLMTRDADVAVSLADRVATANNSDSDLFLSLHRGSTQQPKSDFGVEMILYLTAPNDAVGEAARNVLDALNSVDTQANRGIRRGNSYVLRRTGMPAMILNMGFLQNKEDNRLFDQHLHAYAEAIAKGILGYFGMDWTESPPTAQPDFPTETWLSRSEASAPPASVFETRPPEPPAPVFEPAPPAPPVSLFDVPPPEPSASFPEPMQPEPPVPFLEPARPEPPVTQAPPVRPIPPVMPTPRAGGSAREENSGRMHSVKSGQHALNSYFGVGAPMDGRFDAETKKLLLRAIQTELNSSRNAGIAVDGEFGPAARAALPALRLGDTGNLVLLLQIALALTGYDIGDFGGVFDGRTRTVVQMLQRDNYLVPDGIAGVSVWTRLLA